MVPEQNQGHFIILCSFASDDLICTKVTPYKGSFKYYVIAKGEGVFRNDYANVIFALSNAEFDYGRGGGGLETDKKW